MGIRIHKVLGYGLTDVIADTENWDLRNDSRFDPVSYLFEGEYKFDLAGFIQHLEIRISEMVKGDHDIFSLKNLIHQLKEKTRLNFHESVVYDMEFGESEVMVFVPPGHEKWQRYDDIIDYYDPVNLEEDGGISNSVIMVNRPPWPYESYINTKTMPPIRLTGFQQELYVSMRNLGIEKYIDPEKSFNELGVDNEEEFNKFIVPIIPIELVELIKYLKIFKNENDIYQLRPMIYGYWG